MICDAQPIPKRRLKRSPQAGFIIIEILVSISLLALILSGISRLIILSMHANTSARTFSSLVSEVQDTVDGFRNGSFTSLLDKFNTGYTSITNGQTATTTSTSSYSRATFTITYTAIRTNNEAAPEAVRIAISAQQRRGLLGTISYDFETIVSSIT